MRTYSELVKLKTFLDRYEYLRLDGEIGRKTFGLDRYLNQVFYQRSPEWKHIRREVILRDNGCDLGIDGYEIYDKVLVHHMNPLSKDDILGSTDYLLNPEFLITVSFNTHQAIHYGTKEILKTVLTDRKPGDTCLWR